MTDINGTLVWSADYRPFGQADITVNTVANNFRFPGQYWDNETGLHYNWHRYYDPGIGRYLRADPIGLNGGIIHYIYVQNDPVRWVDPNGLDTVGCDGIPDCLETPCILECCAAHDKCYDDYDCSASSWWNDNDCNSKECDRCNEDVRDCIVECGFSNYDDPNKPNYYCARQHKYVNIPGDFQNRQIAEAACELSHSP
jgi:RHS repeat-associated protein